ncbi:hypothetical protein [Bordetella genomosp. 6]|uniref:hypothetical protein n=1 Tax=Bordetella genomosp. 6 TaxID=463024 RepID=UPI00142E7FE9|nr:hypothetical protein [Bordetella genomosp. 6]
MSELGFHCVAFLLRVSDIYHSASITEGGYESSGRGLLACRSESGETGAARQSNIYIVPRRRLDLLHESPPIARFSFPPHAARRKLCHQRMARVSVGVPARESAGPKRLAY